jgi:hypothetical protein
MPLSSKSCIILKNCTLLYIFNMYVGIINVHLGGNGSGNAPFAFSPEKLLAVDK